MSAGPLLPTPPELFRLLESGRMSREQFHTAMAIHARTIIEEMVEAQRNPVAAYLDFLRNRSAAARLVKRHGEAVVREVLAALGEAPGFPPAGLLWNAGHWDVPLHCFLRTKREPVFRIIRFATDQMTARLTVEHGGAKRGESTREEVMLRRDWEGRLVVAAREPAD